MLRSILNEQTKHKVIFIFSSLLQLSPSFTPTSVIKKMYESKEKSRDDPGSRPGSKEETVNSHNSQEGMKRHIHTHKKKTEQGGIFCFDIVFLHYI